MVGLPGLVKRWRRRALIEEACFASYFAIYGVLGEEILDLLLGLLSGSVSVRNNILSLDRTRLALIGIRPTVAKLDRIVVDLNVSW